MKLLLNFIKLKTMDKEFLDRLLILISRYDRQTGATGVGNHMRNEINEYLANHVPPSPRTKEEILKDKKLYSVIQGTQKVVIIYNDALNAMDEHCQPFIEAAQLSAKGVEIMKGEIDRLRLLIPKAYGEGYMETGDYDPAYEQFKTQNDLT